LFIEILVQMSVQGLEYMLQTVFPHLLDTKSKKYSKEAALIACEALCRILEPNGDFYKYAPLALCNLAKTKVFFFFFLVFLLICKSG
jgi:hypothetical protein